MTILIPTIATLKVRGFSQRPASAGDPSGSKSLIDPLLTMGILSKVHADTAAAPWRGMWQTDAGAIDGNVGGAAVDLEGRLLGMLTFWDPARHGRNSGIAFQRFC